jgi:hypothetical protein
LPEASPAPYRGTRRIRVDQRRRSSNRSRVVPHNPIECTAVEALVGFEAHGGQLRAELVRERKVPGKLDSGPCRWFEGSMAMYRDYAAVKSPERSSAVLIVKWP